MQILRYGISERGQSVCRRIVGKVVLIGLLDILFQQFRNGIDISIQVANGQVGNFCTLGFHVVYFVAYLNDFGADKMRG